MTESELQALIAHHEADDTELTVATSDTVKFSEAVCAFANDLPNHRRPGHLIIGVRDDGTFSQIPVTDQLLQNLASLRDNGNIQPLPSISVERVVTGDRKSVV